MALVEVDVRVVDRGWLVWLGSAAAGGRSEVASMAGGAGEVALW